MEQQNAEYWRKQVHRLLFVTDSFRFLWPCILNIRWTERTNKMQLNQCLLLNFYLNIFRASYAIIRRVRPCTAAYSVLHWLCWLWLPVVVWSCVVSCVHCVKVTAHTVHTAHDASPQDHSQPQPTQPGRTPRAVGHGLILLMMGIMMPETCWDRILIINIKLVACCWFSFFIL